MDLDDLLGDSGRFGDWNIRQMFNYTNFETSVFEWPQHHIEHHKGKRYPIYVFPVSQGPKCHPIALYNQIWQAWQIHRMTPKWPWTPRYHIKVSHYV